jgi:3-methylcrotonyl-CoA carboxylase alpha subunit
MTTSLLDKRQEELTTPPEIDDELLQIAGDGLALVFTGGPTRPVHFEQVTGLRGFRLNSSQQRQLRVRIDGHPAVITLNRNADELLDLGWKRPAQLEVDDRIVVFKRGRYFEIELDEPRGTGTTHGIHDGEIEAPMPGKVTAIEVSSGEKVVKGQRLLTLEAMKMEHALTAPFDGTIAELNAKPGAQVTEGQLLVKVDAEG